MAEQKTRLPAVLVLGIDSPIGLTIIRELGERKVPVYGIAYSEQSIGLGSRYLTKGFVFSGDREELVQFINSITEKYSLPFLMAIAEQQITFLQENQKKLNGITPLIPKKSAMQIVLDKAKTYQYARKIDINTPINYQVTEENIPEKISFPVILKWSDPNVVSSILSKYNIPLLKCEYCYSKEELTNALARYQPINSLPLVQSYCPGFGLGQMIYLFKGEAVLRFQHNRIHEWPPEGGVSSFCESISITEHQGLFHQSIELLKSLNWEGPAMVEYRYNPKTGEAVLMEINGRFWGSIPLAYYSGACFAWTHYEVQVLKKVPEQPKTLSGIRCMFLVPEIKRLIFLVFRNSNIQDKTLTFNIKQEIWVIFSHFFKDQLFYVFSWNDPKPFLLDIWNMSIGRILNLLLRKYK